MQLIPVLDLLDRQVVRGVAGKRESYRPIETPLVDGSDPLAIARVFRDRFGLNRLYLADLDAILSEQPNLDVYRQLCAEGFELLVDPGIRHASDARPIFECGITTVIAGLESLADSSELEQLILDHAPEQLIFSLDLKNGKPLGERMAWKDRSPFEIARLVIEMGIESLLVLDLSQVGMEQGLSTRALCRQIKEGHPEVKLLTGGGVRHIDDLLELQRQGVAGVLISSALHRGSITPDDCRRFTDD